MNEEELSSLTELSTEQAEHIASLQLDDISLRKLTDQTSKIF